MPGPEVRLESWAEHQPAEPYDAIISFGAFEHFARDGTTGPERIATYRSFFARCHEWLRAGGRLGLETIAHDGAPDTAAPRGTRSPRRRVLALFPESICPHLSEIVLGFEPWFEVELLRGRRRRLRPDLPRTGSCACDAHEAAAAEATDPATVRGFRHYLAASEVQFRRRRRSPTTGSSCAVAGGAHADGPSRPTDTRPLP